MAVDVLEVLRFDGPRSARLKLNDYTSSCTFGPLLRELYLRLNGYSGPHLVIDTVGLFKSMVVFPGYGLRCLLLGFLVYLVLPLSLIYRKNCLIDFDFFNIFHAEVNPFDQ